MTDQLNFDRITDNYSLTYIDTLLQPYAEALTGADTMEALSQWIPVVLPGELGDALLQGLTNIEDVQVAKSVILQFLADLILSQQPEIITPWTLATHRDETLTRLFGESSTTLPVVVFVGPNTFVHNLSAEFTHGILHGIQGAPEFSLQLFGQPITLDLFSDINEHGQFSAMVNGKHVDFDSTEFIQGVNTAANWRNIDPHSIVTDLVQYDSDRTSTTPLTFS